MAGPDLKSKVLKTAPANTMPGRSVLNFNEAAVQGGSIRYQVVKEMVDTCIKKLTGQPQTGAAWEKVFPKPITVSDKIAVKLNASYTTITHPEVAKAVVEGLTSMLKGKYPVSNITLYDHGGPDSINFEERYRVSTLMPGVRTSNGRDKRTNLDTVTGYHYPDCLHEAAYLIEVPVLKTHGGEWSGRVSLNFKSHIGTYCTRHQGFDSKKLVNLSSGKVREKRVLSVLDGIQGTKGGWNAGEQPFPTWVKSLSPKTAQTDPCTIILSTDPVASEYLGRQVFRKEFGDPSYGSGPNDIVARSQEAGLGIGDEADAGWHCTRVVNGKVKTG